MIFSTHRIVAYTLTYEYTAAEMFRAPRARDPAPRARARCARPFGSVAFQASNLLGQPIQSTSGE
eukprot:SAG31_NODE_3155_length_4612_cov_2.728784_1_plen_64_part_10